MLLFLMAPNRESFYERLGRRRGKPPHACDDPMATGISPVTSQLFRLFCGKQFSALDAPFLAGEAVQSRDTAGTRLGHSDSTVASFSILLGGNWRSETGISAAWTKTT